MQGRKEICRERGGKGKEGGKLMEGTRWKTKKGRGIEGRRDREMGGVREIREMKGKKE